MGRIHARAMKGDINHCIYKTERKALTLQNKSTFIYVSLKCQKNVWNNFIREEASTVLY